VFCTIERKHVFRSKVRLGKIDLKLPYYYDNGVYHHILLLSWAASLLFEFLKLDNGIRILHKKDCSLQGITFPADAASGCKAAEYSLGRATQQYYAWRASGVRFATLVFMTAKPGAMRKPLGSEL